MDNNFNATVEEQVIGSEIKDTQLPNADADTGNVTQEGQDVQEQQEKTYTVQDLQSEVDKRVTQALKTAREGWERETETKVEKAVTEAEKLAKMSADQKAEHEKQKKEAEFARKIDEVARREAEITRRELKATALEALVERGLPIELAEIISYTDADACNNSVDIVEKAFKRSVDEGIKKALTKKEVPKTSPKADTDGFLQGFMKG